MPISKALSMIWQASDSGVFEPKCIVPRHILLTVTLERPNLVYCITLPLGVELCFQLCRRILVRHDDQRTIGGLGLLWGGDVRLRGPLVNSLLPVRFALCRGPR